jgi:hypothetical protein
MLIDGIAYICSRYFCMFRMNLYGGTGRGSVWLKQDI